jgi:hypothetical protein
MPNDTAELLTEEEQRREQDIIDYRLSLQENIHSAIVVATRARKDRAYLASNAVYDVEHAENSDSETADRFLAQAVDSLRAALAIVGDVHRNAS